MLDHVSVVEYANLQNVEFAAGFVDSQQFFTALYPPSYLEYSFFFCTSLLLKDTERKISTALEFRFIGSCVKIKSFYCRSYNN